MKNIFSIMILMAFTATTVSAQSLGHTDIASFNSELSGTAMATTLDFDSLAGGDMITSGSSVNGFGFVYDFGGVDLQVGNTHDTSSGSNYLGTNDADLLQDGDNFAITVDPSNAFGIRIVTADALLDGDISLTFNGTTVDLVGMDIEATLNDGSFVYFLGITNDSATDTTAMISTLGDGVFLYNVDDMIRAANPSVLLGDVNLDGLVNLLDVEPFIERISTGFFQPEADINDDGFVNLLDVDPFIALLSGG